MLSYSDFPIGRTFPLGPKTVTEEEITAFAKKFDPQPFHLDPASDQAKQVGGLIASGWHTCAIFMRMICDAYLLNTHSQGSAGLDEVRWLKPVRPGDILTGEAIVAGGRVSKSRPDMGLIDFQYRLDNQHGEPVMTITGMGMVCVGESQGTAI